jgi:potassium/hydrogen antiporter
MVEEALILMGVSVVVAVLGQRLYESTGVPESVFMLSFGILLGPVTGFITVADILWLVPYVFTLSIVIILLESSLGTRVGDVLETMRVSTLFTVIVLVVTTVLCGLFAHLVMGWDPLASMLLGVISSGTSTLPIIYFTSRMRLSKEAEQLLVFESIINDVTILTAVSLLLQLATLTFAPSLMVWSILRYIAVALAVGLIIATVWVIALTRFFEDLKYRYIATLALTVILYSLTESLEGSGVVAVMVFGVAIGNLPEFFRSHKLLRRQVKRFFTQIQVMQDEITFLVKNIFFLMMGMLFEAESMSVKVVLIVLSLMGLMVVSRAVSVRVISLLDNRYMRHITEISLMLPRGLTAGLAALMPLERGLDVPLLKDIVILMVVLTNVMATIGFMAVERRRR